MTGKSYPVAWALALFVAGTVQAADAPGASRTAWGDPDLQGLWASGTHTPFQRPAEYADRPYLTPAEAKNFLDGRATAYMNRDKKEYDDAFTEFGPLVKSLRTSLIIDPQDGKLPPLTEAAQKAAAIRKAKFDAGVADGPEDRRLGERCIYFSGAGPGMIPEAYNSHYVIVQTKDYVLLAYEMAHLYRIIRLRSGSPSLPQGVSLWVGNSIGHWEGDTLVVESSNITPAQRFPGSATQTDQNLRVLERFTRTAPDTLMYRATITDPTVYTSPFTVEYNLYPFKGPLLETACHEGNYGMVEILSGRRAEEAKRAARTGKTGNASR